MVILTARGAGFHTLSPLGTPLAPNVFLNAGLNPQGRLAGSPETGWETADSAARADYGIHVTGGSFAGAGVFTGVLEVGEITFTRMEGGSEVEIGVMTFDPPLTLELAALRDDAGRITGWGGDLAPVLAEAVRTEGLVFEGGAGDDVFDPLGAVLPVYGGVTLNGRGGDDNLVGGRNDDVIRGGRGDDSLSSSGGRDWLHGGAGDDLLNLGTYSEGSEARGGAGNDVLRSSNGADVLIGGAGNDRLEGGRGGDRLRGGAGNDRLRGDEGDDRLAGGAGNDELTGGLGADTFVFRADQQGHDRITDYDASEGDRLVLRGIGDGEVGVATLGDDLVLSWNDGASSLTLEGLGGQEDLLPF